MKISIEKIKNLLTEGELTSALNILTEEAKGTSFEIESTLLISRFNKVTKEKNNNIISEELEQIEYNKIVISTLELLSRAVYSFFCNEVLFEEILFYETSQEYLTPKQNREYATEFYTEKVRHIGWELPMRYPKIINTFNYVIKWHIIKPTGKITPTITSEFSLQTGWTNSWVAHSWGDEKFGTWEKGISAVKLYIGDKLISEGKFLIK
jgi:hypothetical protein